eukprot:TRINITY_DN454_c0_g1_i1.p1 TRINITY_DN454_c0_g1~~TRINITY_DN454_c0_g1_i1.p1  ORF type:complete len:67 (+),score=18.69 TRINITY_DN454_c0_g1_i1:91-291(+)
MTASKVIMRKKSEMAQKKTKSDKTETKKEKLPLGPLALGLLIFVVAGSALLPIIQNARFALARNSE